MADSLGSHLLPVTRRRHRRAAESLAYVAAFDPAGSSATR